jgi:hypothetical protein
VDLERMRISLTMKREEAKPAQPAPRAQPRERKPEAPRREKPKPAPMVVPVSGTIAPNGMRFK